MAQINLTLKKGLFIPKFFPLLFDYSKRWQFWCGSPGSGKSYTIAQRIIISCTKEPIRVLVCRRYATTLRNSCFALFKEILTKWRLLPYVKIKETDMSITFPNGSQIIMVGLDTEEKLLSLTNISTVWVEEAYEVEKSKVEQLNLRMRGTAANQQLILSWNPISKHSWLYEFTVKNPPENSVFIHSTYKDNPFLNPEYVQALDEMEIRNPEKYRVYGRGEWGVDSSGLVIKNWKTGGFDAMELAAAIKDMNLAKSKIKVDAAEPRTIQFFRNEGINAEGAAKGKDSVKAGLMFLQDNLIIVHPKCQNFITELENFSYIKSKQTGEWTEDTTHEWSHAIDACRYAYSDIYTNKQLKTLSKTSLSL